MASVTFDNATRLYPGGTRPAVDKLNLEVADGETVAVIGPYISQRAYEVGEDFMDRFLVEDPESSRFFSGGPNGRPMFNLPGFGLARLRDLGVSDRLARQWLPLEEAIGAVLARGRGRWIPARSPTVATASTSAVRTAPLQLPTSETIASSGRSSANSAATAPIAPTGTHRMTKSASITLAPAVSATSSARSSARTVSRTWRSAS